MNLGGTIRFNKLGIAMLCFLFVLFILYMSPRDTLDYRYSIGESVEVNLKRLLLVSISAAERGGKEVVKVIQQANLKEKNKGKTKEGVSVPVTNADLKSHCVMYYGISKIFPAIKVISEESRPELECQQSAPLEIEVLENNGNLVSEGLPDIMVPADQLAVWIDPLDATKEYTQELYNFVTTMVCVAHNSVPIIGIIHKPFGSEPKTTWAWLNQGMSSNLRNGNTFKSEKHTVIISRSHPGTNVDEKVKSAFGKDANIIHAGGAGYKSLEVAVGNVTAYVHTNEISKWDICAGNAIINSLKGSFTDLSGDQIDYSASSNNVHEKGLLAMISEPSEYIQRLKG